MCQWRETLSHTAQKCMNHGVKLLKLMYCYNKSSYETIRKIIMTWEKAMNFVENTRILVVAKGKMKVLIYVSL